MWQFTCKLQSLGELLPGDQVLGDGSLDHEVSRSGDLGHPVIRFFWCHPLVIVIRGCHPLRYTWHAGCYVTNNHTLTQSLISLLQRIGGQPQTMAIVYKICDASAATTGTPGQRINDDLYNKYNHKTKHAKKGFHVLNKITMQWQWSIDAIKTYMIFIW